jgi:hypothetical protein
MKNWKRIVAKEWLIFLASFVAGAFLLGYATPFTVNTVIAIKFDMEVNKYQEQMKEYVQNNLRDWKPEKPSAKEFINSGWIPDDLVITFQKLHPEYADFDIDSLHRQLPKLDLSKLPQHPNAPTYYHYYTFLLAMLTGFLFYFGVVLIRSTIWAVKYLKKENIN